MKTIIQKLGSIESAITLTYQRACELASTVGETAQTMVLDVTNVEDIESSAIARLLILKETLRRRGGDLHLIGLHARAKARLELYRLDAMLDANVVCTCV